MSNRNRKSDGYKLFVRMARALHKQWCAPIPDSVPDSNLRNLWRKADTTTVRRCLDQAAKSAPKVQEGFFLALTDYIGSAPEVTWDHEHYLTK